MAGLCASEVKSVGKHVYDHYSHRSAHLPADRLGGARTLASTSVRSDAYVGELLKWLPEENDQLGTFVVTENSVSSLDQSPTRILLADDNIDIREYLRLLLATKYDVEAVADGESALAATRREGHGIPAIAVTGYAGAIDESKALNAGYALHLSKPIELNELAKAIARVSRRV